jgi:hypothetical protein
MREIGDARVWAGRHWRHAVTHGAQIGRRVAAHITMHYFQPMRQKRDVASGGGGVGPPPPGRCPYEAVLRGPLFAALDLDLVARCLTAAAVFDAGSTAFVGCVLPRRPFAATTRIAR